LPCLFEIYFFTKQLQAAVEKRNEIISQLSKNLQGALQSRDQVQLEAQELSGQIQALQQQLQQVNVMHTKKQPLVYLTPALIILIHPIHFLTAL